MWETRLIGAPYGPNKTGKLGKYPTLFIQGIKSLIGNSGQKSANRKQWGYSIPSNRKQGFPEISVFLTPPLKWVRIKKTVFTFFQENDRTFFSKFPLIGNKQIF